MPPPPLHPPQTPPADARTLLDNAALLGACGAASAVVAAVLLAGRANLHRSLSISINVLLAGCAKPLAAAACGSSLPQKRSGARGKYGYAQAQDATDDCERERHAPVAQAALSSSRDVDSPGRSGGELSDGSGGDVSINPGANLNQSPLAREQLGDGPPGDADAKASLTFEVEDKAKAPTTATTAKRTPARKAGKTRSGLQDVAPAILEDGEAEVLQEEERSPGQRIVHFARELAEKRRTLYGDGDDASSIATYRL